ncbi:hypothetical protein K443DRAFT_97036 [Laccaria amethystina LaAM-08-1]|uniref:Unplaced genomic scaffold K443scaffold_59, whole genome shotgun sequence n=1 Tax=Laccaria amethystina LaAM-08-1 TaxID=1095629 RepID=A0A0C9WTJ1_9AGAR|nr:hypothetical protein K443DRAFT_97036 [Laccaria amethystina LaAM-08-1]
MRGHATHLVLGGVMNAVSHVTTPLLTTATKCNKHPAHLSTIGHKNPPPHSRNSNDRPQTSTGTQHNH